MKSKFDKIKSTGIMHEKILLTDINFLMECTSFICDKNHKFNVERHIHDEMEVCYIYQGKFSCIVDKEGSILSAGDIYIAQSNIPHSLKNIDEDGIFYNFIFDFSFLNSRYIDICELNYLMPIISNEIYFKKIIKDDKELGDVLLSILKENNSKAYGYELSIKGYMYLFLSILCKKYVEQGKLVIYEKSLKKINSILKFMENNFCDELRLDYICREFKMKKSNFCNMFKKKTGKTYIQYLNTLRVTEAATLLNQSNSSVTYISSSVGFDDVNYFSKVFKKHFNVSPQNYRNQMLNKDVNSK